MWLCTLPAVPRRYPDLIVSLRLPCSTLRSRSSSLSNVLNSAIEELTKLAKISASLPPSANRSAKFKPVRIISLVWFRTSQIAFSSP
jgi:hypothetical protein